MKLVHFSSRTCSESDRVGQTESISDGHVRTLEHRSIYLISMYQNTSRFLTVTIGCRKHSAISIFLLKPLH